MLTIEDILDLREQYKAQVDTLLLKIEVLTDLMVLAEKKEPTYCEKVENVVPSEVVEVETETTYTDESY